MGKIEMGLLGSIKELLGNIMTNGVKVNSEVAKKRLQICLKCPHLLMKTGSCKKCGCFVSVKTQYADQFCKLGKW